MATTWSGQVSEPSPRWRPARRARYQSMSARDMSRRGTVGGGRARFQPRARGANRSFRGRGSAFLSVSSCFSSRKPAFDWELLPLLLRFVRGARMSDLLVPGYVLPLTSKGNVRNAPLFAPRRTALLPTDALLPPQAPASRVSLNRCASPLVRHGSCTVLLDPSRRAKLQQLACERQPRSTSASHRGRGRGPQIDSRGEFVCK